MGQRLRVAGWLRFSSKARLTKGLNGFRAREAPGYYEARHWQVAGLDAWIRLDAELPGDFDDVEAPFLEMIRAAACGYVDYFEEGSKKNQTQGQDPVKRWDRHAYDKQPKLMSGPIFDLGSAVTGFSDKDAVVLVSGTLSFADAAAAAAAAAPIALPYLAENDIREVCVLPEVRGVDLVVAAACHGPLYRKASVLEAPLVAWARALSVGARGALTVQAPFAATTRAYTLEDGAESVTFVSSDVKVPAGTPEVRGAVVRGAENRGTA